MDTEGGEGNGQIAVDAVLPQHLLQILLGQNHRIGLPLYDGGNCDRDVLVGQPLGEVGQKADARDPHERGVAQQVGGVLSDGHRDRIPHADGAGLGGGGLDDGTPLDRVNSPAASPTGVTVQWLTA